MTIIEFNNTRFGSGMHVTYDKKIRDIISVNFHKNLIGLVNEHDSEEIDWVRCENVQLIKE